MTANPATPLLDTVDTPDDLRQLAPGQLRQLADELRAEMISAEVLEKRMPLNSRLATHREIAVIPQWMKNPARLSNM